MEETNIIEHIINKSFRIPSKTKSFHQNRPYKEKCIEHGRWENRRLSNNPLFSFISCNSSKVNKFVKTPEESRKKYMHETVTCIFIESMDNNYDKYTEKIVNIIYSNIQTYIKLKNKRIDNKIKENDIILLFKGGNVINHYIKRVIGKYRNLESNLDEKTLKTLHKLRKIDTNKKSDWDFSIEINIKDRHLYLDVLGDIKNLAWYITYQLKLFFDKEITDGNFDNIIYAYLETLQYSFIKNELYKDEINAFSENIYKTVTKINTFGFDIDAINISKSDKLTTQSSKVISTRTEKDTSQDIEVTLNDDASIRVPFVLFNDDTKYKLNQTNVSMVHIDHMTINKKKSSAALDICRIKIRNSFTFENGSNETIQCELVDISIMENQDIHLKNVKRKNVMVTLYRGKEYPIYPSADYLFFDLYISLFSSMFPWDTVKYDKRMKRMGYIISFLYTRNYKRNEIPNLIANLKKLLKVIYNFHIAKNIKNKIQFVKNNITIQDNKIILSKNLKNLDKELKIILSEYFEIILYLDYLYSSTNNSNITKYFDNIINKTRNMQHSFIGDLAYYKNKDIKYYLDRLDLFEKQLLKMLKLIKDIVNLDLVS